MKTLVVAFAALALGSSPLRAGADLILEDGKVLEGTSLERSKEGVYLLKLEDGQVVIVPVELVKRIRLTGGEMDDAAPTGLRPGPENLAGVPVEPPKTREQLASFGRAPARFRRATVATEWTPVSGLGPDVTEFNPVRWFRAPTDFNWTPTSAFTVAGDVTEFNPVRWYRSPTDPIWRPTSGWRTATVWFPH